MSNESRICNLSDEGEHLFLYSDKYNVHFLFWSNERSVLYHIKTTKNLDIELAEEVETPESFSFRNNVKFFKPYVANTGEITFIGIVNIAEGFMRFTIENDKMVYSNEVDHFPSFQLKTIAALDPIEIKAHVQKKNKIFFVGVDLSNKYKDNVYAVFNLETTEFEQRYYLYTDKGEINLNTVSLDLDEYRVYVAGFVKEYESDKMIPYTEIFFLRKS